LGKSDEYLRNNRRGGRRSEVVDVLQLLAAFPVSQITYVKPEPYICNSKIPMLKKAIAHKLKWFAVMNVDEFNKVHLVNNLPELEAILNRRQPGNVNAFCLSKHIGGFPALSIFIKGDLAVLHYQLIPDEPGFRSLGEEEEGESVYFSIGPNSGDDIEEPSEAIVSFQTALQAAKEFFVSNELPQSVKWIEL
jgi:hypothetical protein